ncbi:MAG: (2Fe-2S)-binding protein [Desulfobacterales bacterium]|nr:(2Fe-2S)-binding protein [Desulfobacterales bacterium]
MKNKTTCRLNQLPTLKINPNKSLSFFYQGQTFQGLFGDTIATALYANGVRIFSRSIKYHRVRGLYSLDTQAGQCLMEVDGVPNVRAENTLLQDGMVVAPQNIKGSPDWDWFGFLGLFSWAMPAGFYYRNFHKPYKLWPFFIDQIRKIAGIGVIKPDFKMPGKFDEQYINTDVCIIGGGPSGINAALAAVSQGLKVVILESKPWLGGFYDYRISHFTKAQELVKQLSQNKQVRIFCHTFFNGFFNGNNITAFQKGNKTDSFTERYIEVRAKSIVIATGCQERPLIFDNNDLPGIMQINCAHRLLHTYGILPGERAVFSVSHDLGLESALDLNAQGVKILTIADSRFDGQNPQLIAQLEKENIPFLRGWVAAKAIGHKKIRGVRLSSLEGAKQHELDCDLLVASAGLTPASALYLASSDNLYFDFHTGFYLPKKFPKLLHPAGRLLGFNDPSSIEASGYLAGLKAAQDCGVANDKQLQEAFEKLNTLPGTITGSKLIQAPLKGSHKFVCLDEDVTVTHIEQGCDMGFDTPEINKRFTAAGTGHTQGAIPGHNLPLLMAQYNAAPIENFLPTKVRSPLIPTLLSTYAGRNHDMFKITPVDGLLQKAGAIFRRIGVWKRARYFSDDFSCQKEIESVRNGVGLIDVSTLGKFRIFGPDAQKALDRIYVGNMSQISTKKAKYSAMCNEDGCLIDDGVIVKCNDNDYYFTTSTARASATNEWFRYHTRYDNWDYHIVNLTDTYGAINIAGPNARKVLQKLTDADISNDAFPYLGYREFLLNHSVPVRVMRLGFVGELSYEIHIPASMMESVWEWIIDAGSEFNIQPFGVEAQNALRLEKGHIIIGQESEIRTTLHDLGLGVLWYKNKSDAKTVGYFALKDTEHQKDRFKLCGFEIEDLEHPKDGSIIVEQNEIKGYVCTARYSFALKKEIGLSLVKSDLTIHGKHIEIFQEGGKRIFATVVPLPFYDPKGLKLRN